MWFGVEVEWSTAGAEERWTKVLVEGEERARWNTHALSVSQDSDESIGWVTWVHNGRLAFTLAVPCASEPNQEGLPADPVAATFWALTCWDEQHHRLTRDHHGRPTTEQLPWTGLAGSAEFGNHTLPLNVQHRWPWVEIMWHSLLTEWGFELRRGLTFQPSVDVDVAFKHLGRPRWKTWVLQVRDVLLGRLAEAAERLRVIRGHQQDPYDTYGWLKEVHVDEELWWFVLAARRSKPYDIGLDPEGSVLPHLVESLSWHPGGTRVGWHPGYQAMNHKGVREEEGRRFGLWEGSDGKVLRAHFLRSEPGEAWEWWDDCGVETDASLGWSRDVGFRAGVSRPFRAYSLNEERGLGLSIHPVAVMDSALRVGQGWSPERARTELESLMKVVSDVGGVWMSCWHNTSVSNRDEWAGWRATFLHMVRTARGLA